MEDKTILNEILNVLKAFGEQNDRRFEQIDRRFEQIDQRFDKLETEMREGFERIDKRLDNLDNKFNGLRAELQETQENVHYLLSKNAQHEQKLHELSKQ